MSTNTKKQIKEIQAENFNDWSVSFWLIKRKAPTTIKEASYHAWRVDMDKKLPTRRTLLPQAGHDTAENPSGTTALKAT